MTGPMMTSLKLDSVCADEKLDLGCGRLRQADEELVDTWYWAERVDKVTVQEDG